MFSCSNGYVTSELLNHQLLNHPHVIGFRGVWVSTNSINIVMEVRRCCSIIRRSLVTCSNMETHVNMSMSIRASRHYYNALTGCSTIFNTQNCWRQMPCCIINLW